MIVKVKIDKTTGLGDDVRSNSVIEGIMKLCVSAGMKQEGIKEDKEQGLLDFEYRNDTISVREELELLANMRNKLNRQIATLKKSSMH